MTYLVVNRTIDQVWEEIISNGMQGLEAAVSPLINEAMKAERSRVLRADPWHRSDQRRGYADRYKPRSLTSRILFYHRMKPSD